VNRLRVLILALAVSVIAPSPAWAAPPPAAQREIDQLLRYLEKSGCEFQRNGKWHDARAAREHIEVKYRYLLQRDMVQSTEGFIADAATASTMGGAAYQVRCAGMTQPSAAWLRAELARMRKSGAGTPK
jgi:Family of unknown function (DUF5329)